MWLSLFLGDKRSRILLGKFIPLKLGVFEFQLTHEIVSLDSSEHEE